MIYTSKEQNSQCGLSFFLKVTVSSIIFYYLSQFLIVLIHFMVNGRPLLIPSLLLILTQRKKFGSHLYAFSESLSQFKWIFKTIVSFHIVYYISVFFQILILYKFNSRKKILWKLITPQRINWEIFMKISLKL